jgi:hypothetical protein
LVDLFWKFNSPEEDLFCANVISTWRNGFSLLLLAGCQRIRLAIVVIVVLKLPLTKEFVSFG